MADVFYLHNEDEYIDISRYLSENHYLVQVFPLHYMSDFSIVGCFFSKYDAH